MLDLKKLLDRSKYKKMKWEQDKKFWAGNFFKTKF